MHSHNTEIIDVAEHSVKLPVEIPAPVVHWLREHTVRDLEKILLEMHSAGEDITGYVPVLEDLEQREKTFKLKGDLPARPEETNPLEYVEKEMRETLIEEMV